MRAPLVISLFALTACGGSIGVRGLPVVRVRGNANALLQASVNANVNVKVDARVRVEPPPPPPPPAPAVELQGAPVVEFFGIPLEGAQDVVFVLDVSGSMDDPASGQLAQVNTTTAPPPPPPPPAGPPAAPSASITLSVSTGPGAPPPPPPPPPTADPNGPPPVDPNAPPPNGPQPPPPTTTTTVETRGPRKIEVAQAELIEALSRLPAGTRMNIVFFNSNVDAIAPTILVLDEQNRPTIEAYVRETDADGRTALAPAMRVAFLLNAKRVVLLSDGLGNVNGNSDDVMRDAREAVRAGIRIDTVGIGTDQDRWLLSSLASESGGLYQAF